MTSGDRTRRLPRRSKPETVEYTREGMEQDQERIKVVRKKTIRHGTLTGGEGTATVEETLADMPAGNAYNVMMGLADHLNCEVTPK